MAGEVGRLVVHSVAEEIEGAGVLGTIYKVAQKIKKSRKPPALQALINSMHYDPGTVVVRIENLDYVEVDDCRFCVSNQIDSIQRVVDNPWFANIRPSDIVLDIGANIGAITIPLAKIARKVYAVEPLFTEELALNIKLNSLDNVEILRCGVGPDADKTHYEFSSKQGIAPSIRFNVLLERLGRIDFIKIDGEGCEWDIEPEQLTGIRELRVEFHIRRAKRLHDEQRLDGWLGWLKREDYIYTTSSNHDYRCNCKVSPGPCVPFSRLLVLNATKRDS